ncbi:MAG TPA: BON domain-containing protein [Pseudolysinimonas sp.]|nr:BON domain-containing protein [Pseudolysinimonas sp.]
MSTRRIEHAPDSDARLARRIMRRLDATPVVDAGNVDVCVDGGRVELRGSVESFSDRLACAEIAESLAGAGSVTNELRVRPFDEGWQLGPSGPTGSFEAFRA